MLRTNLLRSLGTFRNNVPGSGFNQASKRNYHGSYADNDAPADVILLSALIIGWGLSYAVLKTCQDPTENPTKNDTSVKQLPAQDKPNIDEAQVTGIVYKVLKELNTKHSVTKNTADDEHSPNTSQVTQTRASST